jgi:2-polyprenyl-6-methoxyphenol hydroxylase-like FAD-dependent oxidoreductase
LADEVTAAGQPFDYACVGRPDGTVIARVNTKKVSAALGHTSVGIHRADLHEILARAFGPDHIHCNHELASVASLDESVQVAFSNGASSVSDILVGADGLRSKVRENVFGASPLRDAGQACWRGVVDRSALARPDAVERTTAWELWGRGGRFGYLSINARQIYWYATLSTPLADFPLEDLARFRARFTPMWNETVQDILNATPDDAIVAAALMDRVPAAVWHSDRVVLLGDAIHPTTPNMGQGACMAIESAWALAYCLSEEPNPHAAFAFYHELRAARTRMITQQSYRMGGLFQTLSPVKARLRNAVFSVVPVSLQERAVSKLLAETPLKFAERSA